MGSLKLKEILRYQKAGGCCRSLCVHCRGKHAKECSQRKPMAIIDYSKGVDVGESFYGKVVKPTQYKSSIKSLSTEPGGMSNQNLISPPSPPQVGNKAAEP